MKRRFMVYAYIMLMAFVISPYVMSDISHPFYGTPALTVHETAVETVNPNLRIADEILSETPCRGNSQNGVSDIDSPSITSPADIFYEAGDTGHVITWVISDFTPTNYELSSNDTNLESTTWPSGDQLDVDVDNLHPGFYNYSLIVYDNLTNYLQDTVSVTVVDTTPPTLTHPQDIFYKARASGNSITWAASDIYPDIFEIHRNGTLLHSGYWDGNISISVDWLDPGIYNYSIIVYDDYDNHNEDLVSVRVVDTESPVISRPASVTFVQGEMGHNITWVGSDFYPSTYDIFRNDYLIASGHWNLSSAEIVITLDDLVEGVHTYQIVLYDTSGNNVTDEVTVTVISPFAWLVPVLLVTVAGCSLSVSLVWFLKYRRKEEEPVIESEESLDEKEPVAPVAPEDVTTALIEESKRIPERIREESMRRIEELDGTDEDD